MSDSNPTTASRADLVRRSLRVCAGLILTSIHIVYASWTGLEIFRRLGGFTDIGGGWTEIGGVDWSWTPLAWLPAGVLFLFADMLHFDPLAGAGLYLAFCGSGGAAFSAVQAYRALTSSTTRRFGSYAWKLWLPLLLWLGWVPVPFEMTLTYWHTVKY
jgi:hypothetical protein